VIFIIAVTLFFIVLRFTVTVFNFISDPKLRRVNKRYNDLVSILIPVRNEEDNILTLLESISCQDYQNYEVIIVDDDSSDNTYELCQIYAKSHPSVRIVKGEGLPIGWLGKNHACHQLAGQASGKFFLFLDADEKVSNQLINSAVHRMYLNKLSLLSLFTNQDMLTTGEKLVVPLMNFILLNLLPLRLVYLTKNSAVAAASGQFMFFDAGVYQKHQWHKMVKDKVVEDVEIMRLIKSSSFTGETLLANGMISCRMYKGYEEAVDGFSKNFLAAFNYSIPGFFTYMLLIIVGPLVILSTLNLNLIVFMGSLILISRVMISLSSGQRVWYNTLLHPLQMFNLMLIGFLSVQKHITKNTLWKGRRV
jgi:glycosyltransferase involved in cell wall biosynthesis